MYIPLEFDMHFLPTSMTPEDCSGGACHHIDFELTVRLYFDKFLILSLLPYFCNSK